MRFGVLLDGLLLGVPAYQGVENREDVSAVFNNAMQDVSQTGVLLSFSMPLGQHRGRNFDVPAKLLRRVAAQEQAVKERGLPLGKREVGGDFGGSGYELCRCGHRERAVYRKAPRRQVVRANNCRVPDPCTFSTADASVSPAQPWGCPGILT